jgi:hypothetical protein
MVCPAVFLPTAAQTPSVSMLAIETALPIVPPRLIATSPREIASRRQLVFGNRQIREIP